MNRIDIDDTDDVSNIPEVNDDKSMSDDSRPQHLVSENFDCDEQIEEFHEEFSKVMKLNGDEELFNASKKNLTIRLRNCNANGEYFTATKKNLMDNFGTASYEDGASVSDSSFEGC